MQLSAYRAVLTAPSVPRLLAAALLARFPFGMAGLATLLLVEQATGSYSTAGLVAGALAAGTAVGAPLLGRLVDRYGQPRVLTGAGLGYAAGLAALTAAAHYAPAPVQVACAALAGSCLPPVGACLRTLWSALVGDGPALRAAFGLESTVQELIFIVGPLVVVGVAELASPAAALLAAGALALSGTLWFAAAPAVRATRGRRPGPSRAGALRSGGIRLLIAVSLLLLVAFGMLEVAVTAFAERAGNQGLAGPLFALWSAGSMAGGLLFGAWGGGSPIQRLAVFLGLVAAGLLPLAAAGTPLQMAPLILIAGLAIAPALACIMLVADAVAPAVTRTEAFTWLSSGFTAGSAGGNALGGALVEHLGTSATFVAASLAAACAAAIALRGRGRFHRERAQRLAQQAAGELASSGAAA